jgi:ABC-2 type transport system permease protein
MTSAALIIAYGVYAQPRLSTSIEPVLVRPVTRRGIFLTRYSGIALLLAASAVAEVLLLDLFASRILGQPLPVPYLGPLIASLLATALAFSGLVFLLSHGLRSANWVIACALALAIGFGVFWGSILPFIYSVNGAFVSPYNLMIGQLRMEMISPVTLPTVGLGFLTGSDTQGGAGSAFALAGISVGGWILLSLLWVVLPVAGAFWLATQRD